PTTGHARAAAGTPTQQGSWPKAGPGSCGAAGTTKCPTTPTYTAGSAPSFRTLLDIGLSALLLGLVRLGLGELTAHVLHVEALDGFDELGEALGVHRAGLAEHEDALAEGHEGGDRGDLSLLGDRLLGLGVDLRERHLGVGLGDLLED